jgi:uncharacterized RDD family membrane protein YckC
MNDPNPYRAPAAVVADIDTGEALAGRGARLGGAILDTIILLIILFPLMYLGGYWRAVMAAQAEGHQPPIGLVLLWTAIGFVVLVLVQGFPLRATGQTWGKRMVGIKIVDLEGNKPPLGRLLGLRYLPVQIVAAIPIVGMVAVLVDLLLIFRKDRRCVHDLIAGTKVVSAK